MLPIQTANLLRILQFLPRFRGDFSLFVREKYSFN